MPTTTNSTVVDFSILLEDAGAEAHLEALNAVAGEIHVDDSTNRAVFIDEGLIPAIAQALKHSYNEDSGFIFNAYHIFTTLTGTFDDDPAFMNQMAAESIVSEGGLQSILDLLESKGEILTYFYVYHAMVTIAAVQLALLESDSDLKREVGEKVMPVIVGLMEHHALDKDEEKSSSIYVSGCQIFLNCCCAMEELEKGALWKRTVQCVWNGITIHRTDGDVQDSGRHLLTILVGPEAAVQMIDHAEMHHSEDAECSCAA